MFFLISCESMGQSTETNLMVAVTDFDAKLEEYIKKYPKLEGLILLNPGQTIYPPGNVMPINPRYYRLSERINEFKNLKHLRLQGLYSLDLPNNIMKCKLRTIAIPLCPSSNIESILAKLKKCQYLEEYDLVNVVLSDEKMHLLRTGLPHLRFVNLMDDISFDDEITN